MTAAAADPSAPLIAGGAADPSIAALIRAFARGGRAVQPVVIGDAVPVLAWHPGAALMIDGIARTPSAMFMRHDVFGSAAAQAMAWTAALIGWLMANPSVHTPNRAMWSSANHKPAALALAAELGLRIPATLVTNDRAAAEAFLGGAAKIAKPVAGGDLARPLEDAMAMASRASGAFAAPAIIQERLVPPEIRIFVVGDRAFGFEVRSRHLDYRAANDAEVIALDEPPAGVVEPLRRLARAMQLDFCAADFKAAADGSLRFLEVNTSPMFARFDAASGGRLCDAMVAWLCAAPCD